MQLLDELRRRKVVQTTAAYLVAAFVAAQVTQLLVDALDLPAWVLRAVVVAEIAAIPVVIALAWAFDVSRAGVHGSDDSPGEAPVSWRRLALPMAGLLVLLAGVGWLISWRGTPPATIGTLAVLPFENTGGQAEDDYFSDGMRDELAAALARLPGLRIAGRTSSYIFKGRAVPAEEIGRVLDVHALVSGTVRRAGDRLRVTAQLVGAADGKVMWDSVFESRSSDVFGVQDEFTRAIVAALMPRLSDRSGAARFVTTNRGTTDVEAYELYLKGRSYLLERGADNVKLAVHYFRQAVDRDPQFARAHAGLSLSYAVLRSYVPAPPEWLSAQEASARRALALDPKLADAHLALGLVHELQMDFRACEAEYRAALALEPGNALVHHVLGFMLNAHGRTDEGLVHLQRATILDPFAKSAGSAYAGGLVSARRFPEAFAEARRVLAVDSTFVLGLYVLGFAQAFGGQPDSAVHTLERALSLYPETSRNRTVLLFAYAAAGRRAEAERLRGEIHADQPGSVNAAFAELVFGDPEPLLQQLTTAEGQREWYQEHIGFGCNPMLDPLWSEPRFRAAMSELGTEECPLAQPWNLPRRPS